HRVLDIGDVLQPQRIAVTISENKIAIAVRMIGLIVGIDLPALGADIDRALWRVGVGAGPRQSDLLEANPVMGKRHGIDVDATGGKRGAADDHLPDALDL